MSHEIDMTTGRAAVFAVGKVPWHGLGTTIENAINSRDAIDLAALNWKVEQWPVIAHDPDSLQSSTANRYQANVRTDTRSVLGIVGKGYSVFQNRDAFDFMDAIVGDRLAMYETAGSLRGGRKVWMLARIPREYHATPSDVILPYVLLVNSHDGSTALRMIPTTVRVVCNNTLNLALRRGGSEGLTIRHSSSLDDRVKDAREKLGLIAARFDQFDVELHAMLDRDMTSGRVEKFFHELLPEPQTDRQKHFHKQTLEQLRENFENPRNSMPGIHGTPWAAYNAVSEWADHQRSFRGATDRLRDESRLNSVWFGTSNRLKQQAYRNALQLV